MAAIRIEAVRGCYGRGRWKDCYCVPMSAKDRMLEIGVEEVPTAGKKWFVFRRGRASFLSDDCKGFSVPVELVLGKAATVAMLQALK